MSYKVINGELVNISKYRNRWDVYNKQSQRADSQSWSKDFRESTRRLRKSK